MNSFNKFIAYFSSLTKWTQQKCNPKVNAEVEIIFSYLFSLNACYNMLFFSFSKTALINMKSHRDLSIKNTLYCHNRFIKKARWKCSNFMGNSVLPNMASTYRVSKLMKGQYFPLNCGTFDVSFFKVEVQSQILPRSLRVPVYCAPRGIRPADALTTRKRTKMIYVFG